MVHVALEREICMPSREGRGEVRHPTLAHRDRQPDHGEQPAEQDPTAAIGQESVPLHRDQAEWSARKGWTTALWGVPLRQACLLSLQAKHRPQVRTFISFSSQAGPAQGGAGVGWPTRQRAMGCNGHIAPQDGHTSHRL